MWRLWTPMVLASEIVLKKRFEDDENFTGIKSRIVG